MEPMYYIGLDVHKRKISYCVKDVSGQLHTEGSIPATRYDLDRWMNTPSRLTEWAVLQSCWAVRPSRRRRAAAAGAVRF